jgi:hypothetical protein
MNGRCTVRGGRAQLHPRCGVDDVNCDASAAAPVAALAFHDVAQLVATAVRDASVFGEVDPRAVGATVRALAFALPGATFVPGRDRAMLLAVRHGPLRAEAPVRPVALPGSVHPAGAIVIAPSLCRTPFASRAGMHHQLAVFVVG